MFINFALDVNDASPADAKVLRAIADAVDGGGSSATVTALDVVKEDRKAEQAKAAPAAKKAAAKKAAPEPEPEEDDADAVLGDEDGDDLESVKERATKLVKDNQIPRVKKALAAAGVKRVSDLTDDNVAEFAAALGDD